MDEEIERIIIDYPGKVSVRGDLKRCEICKINFSANSPCLMCLMRINKEKELGRKVTREEFKELFSFLV